MEKITVEISHDDFTDLLIAYEHRFCSKLKVNTDYTIKKVEIVDDFFKDDPTYHTLKKESNEAYKKLKNYEFKQRNR